MPKPLCFMIMPFGRKPTQIEAGRGPAEIDCNALWDRGFVDDIIAEGSVRWKLDSVLNDLEVSAQHVTDPAQRERLLAVVAQLKLV
jgi:hypothetical protein